MDISLKHEFNTFTLVKRLGIPIFLCTHFFGLTQSFRIFDHAIVYFRKKGKNILFFDQKYPFVANLVKKAKFLV